MHHFKNKMKVNFKLFDPCMKHGVGGKIGGTNVVTPKDKRVSVQVQRTRNLAKLSMSQY